MQLCGACFVKRIGMLQSFPFSLASRLPRFPCRSRNAHIEFLLFAVLLPVPKPFFSEPPVEYRLDEVSSLNCTVTGGSGRGGGKERAFGKSSNCECLFSNWNWFFNTFSLLCDFPQELAVHLQCVLFDCLLMLFVESVNIVAEHTRPGSREFWLPTRPHLLKYLSTVGPISGG